MRGQLSTSPPRENAYRVVYAIHEVLHPTGPPDASESLPSENLSRSSTRFIGLVSLRSINASSLALPEHLTLPAAATITTLTVELSYSLLPFAWGKGFATEAVQALFQTCKSAQHFWTPYSKVYVRAIVNEANPASLHVIAKVGMLRRGVYEWIAKTDEEAVFLAGTWCTQSNICIFGMHLLD